MANISDFCNVFHIPTYCIISITKYLELFKFYELLIISNETAKLQKYFGNLQLGDILHISLGECSWSILIMGNNIGIFRLFTNKQVYTDTESHIMFYLFKIRMIILTTFIYDSTSFSSTNYIKFHALSALVSNQLNKDLNICYLEKCINDTVGHYLFLDKGLNFFCLIIRSIWTVLILTAILVHFPTFLSVLNIYGPCQILEFLCSYCNAFFCSNIITAMFMYKSKICYNGSLWNPFIYDQYKPHLHSVYIYIFGSRCFPIYIMLILLQLQDFVLQSSYI